MPNLKRPIIPEWTKGLPDSTLMYLEDLIEFYPGYKDKASISAMVAKGYIPKTETLAGAGLKLTGCKRASKYFWSLGTLRRLNKDLV